MSREITQSLEGGVMHAFSLVNEFIKVCPDSVWSKPFGKWPVWQQLYHSFAAVDFFLRAADEKEDTSPFGDAGDLKSVASSAPAKAAVKEAIDKAQARVQKYIAGLDDGMLAQKNEGLSARMGRDVNHAATVGLLSSHTMYHLGSCDAALRENGLPGVF